VEDSFVWRLFALCNISTRFTKGMRANDTQVLLFPLRLSMFSQVFSHATIPFLLFSKSKLMLIFQI
jgi:hypothetical protein